MRLLLVEDQVELADALAGMLRKQGYAVDWLADGRDAAPGGLIEPYDAMILDLGLPGLPGLEVLSHWRSQGLQAPVLILTARSAWADRIEGLKAGADDYLAKPFHPEELALRIQGLLRRACGQNNQPLLEAGGIQLDESRQLCHFQAQEIELTAGEFRLLRYLMLNQGRILSKLQLSDHLYDGETERDSNVIEVLINRLRGKLSKTSIETRRGQGYRFVGLAR